MWGLVLNAHSEAQPKPMEWEALRAELSHRGLTSPPGDRDARWSLRTTDLFQKRLWGTHCVPGSEKVIGDTK